MSTEKLTVGSAGRPGTANEVRSILAAGLFSDLVGLLESTEVDFKAEPYRIAEARQKFELAKDVSALANAHGGTILLGVRTTKHDTQPTDEAVEIRPIPDQMINEQAMSSVLEERIYPVVRGVRITRFPVTGAPGHSLVLLEVPVQQESLRPFVTRKFVEQDADKEDGAVFALFERRGANASPMGVPEAQMLLRDGRTLHAILNSREGIANDAPAPTKRAVGDDDALHRLAALTYAAGFSQLPAFALYVEPRPAIDASAMFASKLNPITDLLYAPPEIRDAGFDLNTGAYPEMRGGDSRRAITEGYKALEFWRDGMLAFVQRADEDGVAWATPSPDAPYRINPFALIETVLLFCQLINSLCLVAAQPPETLRFRLQFNRMCRDGRKPELPGRGPRSQVKQLDGCELALFADATFDTPPDQIAAQLVTTVYERFGFEHDRVPFIELRNSARVVSVEQLRLPRR